MSNTLDLRQNKKVSMNRQPLQESPFFSTRGVNVKWPTLRKVYMNDNNVATLKAHVTTKGRSIVFLDGEYITKLNRYVGKAPEERAVFFEYMVKDKQLKGAIFLLCWIGNFHNGCIFHAAPQYPQMNCWIDTLGFEKATNFFERKAFDLYKIVSDILHEGNPIIDEEVKEFIENGIKVV
jgi:hypothetical protein